MRNHDEQFIFERMVEGDKKAFKYFFEKYYIDLCNFINFYINNITISEEIAQDIYVYFWEKRSKIKINTSVRSYLLKASKNKSLNFIRDEKLKLAVVEKISLISDNKTATPQDIIELEQLRNILDSAINNLPEKCRKIYLMAKVENLKYHEIAQRLEISVKTVENQMGQALKKLRENLNPYYNTIFTIFLFICVL